ncbi:MAG: MFS transporter [Actinomycetota bacterium]|jgi:MFS family permease|nr:MFS transporter [Actinomycetota bacterium]MDA3015522.1 MFS transporter [Actinomycetota bacterium]MDA3028165.1 MFS transporter [Actinomycetota bacterium]
MTASAMPVEASTEPGDLGQAARWGIVAAAFLSTFTCFGIAYSFGAFFDSMAEEFGTGKGQTALMFSLTTCFYFMGGVVTGRFADRFGPRRVMLVGAVSMGLGLLLTSMVQSLWVGFITYGIGVGTATACGYVPMVATVGGWFTRRRTMALGLAVSGIGAGTLVCAPVAAALIDAYGWRTTYVIFAVAGTAALLIASIGAVRPPVVGAGGSIDLRAIVRDRRFLTLYSASLITSLALFVPFVFVKSYATEQGISSGSAAAIVGFIGAASIVGRLGLGAIGTRVGPVRLMQFSFFVMSSSYLLWVVAGGSYAMLVVFAVVLGVGYGGFIALSPAAVALLFGTNGLSTILGATYTGAGIGGLFGPPIAGAIIDSSGYQAGIWFAIAMSAVSTVVLYTLPVRSRT